MRNKIVTHGKSMNFRERTILPRISEALEKAQYRLIEQKDLLSFENVENIFRVCSIKLPEPYRTQFINFYVPIMQKDLMKIGSMKRVCEKKKYVMYSHDYKEGKPLSEKVYEVYIRGKRYLKTRSGAKKLESRKNKYIAWVWVDDEKSEIIIGKEERDIKPDSIAFKFLREILKSVGKDLPHETIEEKVTKRNIHQHLNKLKVKSGHVLDDFISGEKRFRFSISRFKSCFITKRQT